jgi:hypothetical protein
MPIFTTTLLKFGPKGEKTGWTYIAIPNDVSDTLSPGRKTSFRVRGMLDSFAIKQVALLPMGDWDGETGSAFILVVNADMRRGIRKQAGATVQVFLDYDAEPMPPSPDLMVCLSDDPIALDFFNTLAKGHQTYFSQWIEGAKTTATKTKRITQAVMGLSMKLGYGEMIRYFKKNG